MASPGSGAAGRSGGAGSGGSSGNGGAAGGGGGGGVGGGGGGVGGPGRGASGRASGAGSAGSSGNGGNTGKGGHDQPVSVTYYQDGFAPPAAGPTGPFTVIGINPGGQPVKDPAGPIAPTDLQGIPNEARGQNQGVNFDPGNTGVQDTQIAGLFQNAARLGIQRNGSAKVIR